MSEETTNTTTEETQGRTYSEDEFQAKLDAAIKERLARERKKTSDKYADYDAIKAKAAKFDEIEEASKSDLQKATEQIEELKAQIAAREEADKKAKLIDGIAEKYSIPAEYTCFLTADTEEELESQAELLGTKFADVSENDGKKPADIKVPKDEMDEFFEQLSEIASNF